MPSASPHRRNRRGPVAGGIIRNTERPRHLAVLPAERQAELPFLLDPWSDRLIAPWQRGDRLWPGYTVGSISAKSSNML
jgi:hypothetical protein